MCGIVAYSGSQNYNIDKIKFLFLSNESRGKDSCGMYSNHPGYGVLKVEGGVSKKLLPLVEIPTGNVFIGHTRQATIGLKTKENAHPFRFNNIVGVHNGQISNWLSVIKEFDVKSSDLNVDSQSIFACLERASDPSDVIKNLEGEMAIVWVDTNSNNTIYCYRNLDRPLFRGKIGDAMYISSLEESLKSIGCSKVEEFKAEYLYEISNGDIVKTRFIAHKKRIVVDYRSSYKNKHYWNYNNHINDSTPFVADEYPITNKKNKNFQIALPNIPDKSREQRDIINELKNIYIQKAPIRSRELSPGTSGSDLLKSSSNKLIELFPDATVRVVDNVMIMQENDPLYKAALKADSLGLIKFLEDLIFNIENFDYAKSNTIQSLTHSKLILKKCEDFKEQYIKTLTPIA